MTKAGSAQLAFWLPAQLGVGRVRAGTSCRYGLGGSMAPYDCLNLGAACGDDAEQVARNRLALERALDLPSAPHWLKQVHGTGVQPVEGQPFAFPPVADACVTRDVGQVLAILTADCLPLLIAADDGSEVAAAHAGWRGLAAGVIASTIGAMRSAPMNLRVWLGPAAGPAAYEVDDPVRDAFLAADADAECGFRAGRPGHYWLDLYAIARAQLARLGVMNVTGGDRCTISEPAQFFSHRRDGRSGRMASLIWIAG